MGPGYADQLEKVLEVQKTVQDIHPFLEKLYPIAIAEDGHFLIYDVEPGSRGYNFVVKTAVSFPIPPGIRAAFPLESYQNRMACVVTGDVFDTLAGYVTIFHEFVHCQQAEAGEQQLKQALAVARRAQAANDCMWEINHPFPYENPDFVRLYEKFLTTPSLGEAVPLRQQLKSLLNQEDYEYLVWQEWKEGLARYIENQINRRVNLPENHRGQEKPFSRVTFYAGGAHFIQLFGAQDTQLTAQIARLFNQMFQAQ